MYVSTLKTKTTGHIITKLGIWILHDKQGRGDGPKAGMSGASEAARAKPGARPG